jgi:hypothetical protein
VAESGAVCANEKMSELKSTETTRQNGEGRETRAISEASGYKIFATLRV